MNAANWRGSPYFKNLRGCYTPGCGYLSEEERLLAEDERYQESVRWHLANMNPTMDEAWKAECARVSAEMDAEIQRLEAIEAQKSQINETQHTQVNKLSGSEPSEPSLQSVVEAVTARQASKKKVTRQKKPLVSKTKYVLLSQYPNLYLPSSSKRKTRSETSDDEELAFYELNPTGKGREVPKKKVYGLNPQIFHLLSVR